MTTYPKLGMIAGHGDLPIRLIEACRASGRELFVLAVKNQTEEALVTDIPHDWIRFGAAGKGLELLHQAGVEDVVFAGKFQRPSLAAMRPDARAAKFLAKAGRTAWGDDSLLSAMVKEFEEEGFHIIGPDDIVADLLAPSGPFGAIEPDKVALDDISRGFAVARAFGAADVGQAVVVQEGIVLGVEAAEGTDRLIARCKDLQREGPGGVLVKVKKPDQERRIDLPAIGLETVRAVSNAGLRGIAVEAGGSLVIDRERVTEVADAAGIFIVGVTVET